MQKRKFVPKNAYEKLYKKPLSERQVFEMRENLKNFFEVLIEVDKREGITAKYEKNK